MIVSKKKIKLRIGTFLQFIGGVVLSFLILISALIIFSDNKLIVVNLIRNTTNQIQQTVFGNQSYSVSSFAELYNFTKGAAKGLMSSDDFPELDIKIPYENIAILESTKYETERPYVNVVMDVSDNKETKTLRGKVMKIF